MTTVWVYVDTSKEVGDRDLASELGISDLRKINAESGRLCGGSVWPIIPSAFHRP